MDLDTPILNDQQKFTNIISIKSLDAIQRNYQLWRSLGTDGERELRESELLTCLDDDEDDDDDNVISFNCKHLHLNFNLKNF